ncbi:MAG: transaldolase [Phenylobacterium sp. RIFCSPHIGHO2_01_FULL_69_31]|uniref:transaldolase n=1 Tax=Phenylobacterium sp. RIFCSPHIGHO2_01_FULL_69_31 TaxID=1801944 RepID=UPI0008C939BC|nr:transaldolase [Phenylobacterium sp. RIFCSPHIGHO2_01_FULL_69_31]OHB26658.1 MAG: transaldolase [Phenylobacterium sp. RIFCSPHIGHO2_01_FULL_69_31]
MTSRLKTLGEAGQAVWLDFIDRRFLSDGGLRKLVEEDGLTGVTSNPSIFEKAMGHGDAYDAGFQAAAGRADASAQDLYESQAIGDVKAAAADLRRVYDRLCGKDGYVSLEVSPRLANDAAATVEEARRLWAAVDEPNLMVKVPGTKAGVTALRVLVEAGVNVNITLLFSLGAYQAVADTYMAGLEARAARGEPIDRIASVASFFVSRIDAQIDQAIDARLAANDPQSADLAAIRGKVAIANAKLAYAWFRTLLASERWQALAAKGARPQRLLWASTGVRDPAYPDTLYVDALVGPNTVTTLPPKTLDAFRDHGAVGPTLTEDIEGARRVLSEAARLGLDLDAVTRGLVEEGITLFAEATDALLGAVDAKRATLLGDRQRATDAPPANSPQTAPATPTQ